MKQDKRGAELPLAGTLWLANGFATAAVREAAAGDGQAVDGLPLRGRARPLPWLQAWKQRCPLLAC